MAAKKAGFSKSGLGIMLSKLQGFGDRDFWSEQHSTEPETAAGILWQAYQSGDLAGRVSADLGCGTGILGIGMLLLGAKKVTFVEKDKAALEIAKKNLDWIKSEVSGRLGKAVFWQGDVREFGERGELVIQNPPFGTKVRHQDRDFLDKSFEIADVVYSLHKTQTVDFLKRHGLKRGFVLTHQVDFPFRLGQTHSHHRKPSFTVKVSCLRFQRLAIQATEPAKGHK